MYGKSAMKNVIQFISCREVAGKPRGEADGLKIYTFVANLGLFL